MKIIQRIIISLLISITLSGVVSAPAFSQTPPPFPDSIKELLPGGTEIDPSKGYEEGYIFGTLIPFVVRLLLQMAAVFSVITLMMAGWFYITAMGDESRIGMATVAITWSIIGLVVALLAYAIVDIILSIEWRPS